MQGTHSVLNEKKKRCFSFFFFLQRHLKGKKAEF